MGLAAASALMSVAVGAFAAHGVGDPIAKDLLRTGAQYQFMHAMACIACALFIELGASRARLAPPLFLGGTVIFSGSLYAMALSAPRWLGAATPLGGLAFMAGWAVLVWAAWGIDRSSAAAGPSRLAGEGIGKPKPGRP
jgi:uncharacterized membrane protein YgdD (TMEM256/DUF423 family)